ncbi:S4 domain-containing protein YaaA [Clostridium intestinale]|jgi:ribosome-associated protein|uniref:S4 domain-containing protein n=2 Tax=Clostridium intestinale TaxID=36845 RepID=U2NIH0_9CLOT|nr:S4 domain-containing protein YaaA [Clostridium intestinale]ERK28656.1 S4 domain-containing protein [Clostridium intestinale URNW]QLY80032.1 S4 domain-containing protein YaaA [Clostridium intestinale]
MNEVSINTEFIKLDSFLKWVGAVSLGSEAKMIIQDGEVLVNGEVCTQRGRKLRSGDIISIDNESFKIV